MRIIDRYDSAIRTSNIESSPDPDNTVSGDSDVLGAMGLAAKERPLAVALTRLFCGDNHAAEEVVAILALEVRTKAKVLRIDLKTSTAEDMAKAVLAWHREGNCRACGGHGFELVPGAPAVGDVPCTACLGARRVPFERQFAGDRQVLAVWLLAEIEREQGRAGPLAMAKLADKLL